MPVWPGVLEHYRPLLSIPEGTPAITLLEGNTPLLSVPGLAREWGAAAGMSSTKASTRPVPLRTAG